MKKVVLSRAAVKALVKHANRAKALQAKIEQYAADPSAFANNVKVLVGRDGKRLRIGDFRVLFTETEDAIIIEDIGPRGEIYE